MKKNLQKNRKILLISLKKKNLKKKQILSICKLKNLFWVWTVPKQIEWFEKKVKKTDINNMLILNNRLVAYTLLRKRKAYVNKKPLIYYYFDTCVVHNKFRGKGLGEILMLFNNKILNKLKKHSFLVCKKKTIPFYLKYNWKKLSHNKHQIMDHKSSWSNNINSQNGMTYNLDKKVKKEIFYYLN